MPTAPTAPESWPRPLPDRYHLPDRTQHQTPDRPRHPLVAILDDIGPKDPYNR